MILLFYVDDGTPNWKFPAPLPNLSGFKMLPCTNGFSFQHTHLRRSPSPSNRPCAPSSRPCTASRPASCEGWRPVWTIWNGRQFSKNQPNTQDVVLPNTSERCSHRPFYTSSGFRAASPRGASSPPPHRPCLPSPACEYRAAAANPSDTVAAAVHACGPPSGSATWQTV